MLLDFTFSNFKCFVTDQQFTMCRPKADRDLQPEGWSIDGVSTVAGVFGGNASGKSSFLEALLSLSCIVSRSVREQSEVLGFLVNISCWIKSMRISQRIFLLTSLA